MVEAAEEYRSFFEQLRAELSDSPAARKDWVGYLFHITDVRNAASILSSGKLLCRKHALSGQQMQNDNAEEEIIRSTNEDISNYVRLYFRPRNPTFFHSEGFKSKAQLRSGKYSAHCPVPIALVFDAAKVLTLPGARFSSGNLAGGRNLNVVSRTDSGVENYKRLPFPFIYHSQSINESDPKKREIIYHKNAEVILHDQLKIQNLLTAIRCRSDAELVTLRTLLESSIWGKYRALSGINNDARLFFADRFFVERVSIVDGAILIQIHRPTRPADYSEEFQAQLQIDYDGADSKSISTDFYITAGMGPTLRIKPGFVNTQEQIALISLFLDGNLAYRGRHYLRNETVVYPSF